MPTNNGVLSPITNKVSKHLFDIDTKSIIERYNNEIAINVAYLFEDIDKISVYECLDTGYRFFYPFSIAGDGYFYEQLEPIPWYYDDWKWDYKAAIKYISNGVSVLDIGCGEGKFLDYLKRNKNCNCIGLELNKRAKDIAVENGLSVKNELIQVHAKDNLNSYDVVMYFQVLEHIESIHEFIKSSIDSLKPGGKLILAVPNNEPYYLTYDKYSLLNLPPHHMGWWNEKSLNALQKYFPIELMSIVKQPLEHYKTYTDSYLKNKFPNSTFMQKILHNFYKTYFYLKRNKINGASIMAVYKKK